MFTLWKVSVSLFLQVGCHSNSLHSATIYKTCNKSTEQKLFACICASVEPCLFSGYFKRTPLLNSEQWEGVGEHRHIKNNYPIHKHQSLPSTTGCSTDMDKQLSLPLGGRLCSLYYLAMKCPSVSCGEDREVC